jgi:8-oxo-dGTP pyrophosphatase MutT (NUDIX family)
MADDAPASDKTTACACAALYREGKFLLGHRSPGKRFYPNLWDFPAGHVRVGETIETGLIREVEEEIGVVPTRYRLVAVLPELNPEVNGEGIYHIFEVTQWTGGEPRLCNDEHTELRWCTSDEAAQLNLADDRYIEIFRQIDRPSGGAA